MSLSSITKILVTLISAGIHFQVSSSPVAYAGKHASVNKSKSSCSNAKAKYNPETAKPVDKIAKYRGAYGPNEYDYSPSKPRYGDYWKPKGKKYQQGGDQSAYPQGGGQDSGPPQQGGGPQSGGDQAQGGGYPGGGSNQSQGGGAGQEGGYPGGSSQNGGGGDQSQGGGNNQSGGGGDQSQGGGNNQSGGGGDQGAYPDKSQGGGGGGGGFSTEEMLKAVNAERSKAGCSALVLNKELTAAAQAHSDWQSSNSKMDHTGEGGSDPSTRCKKAGYGGQCAENVAFNQADIAQVMESWMNSPGHKANILNTQYTEMGAGMTNLYWTQTFGSSGGGGGGSGGSTDQGSGAYPDGGNNQQQGSDGDSQQQGSGGDSQQQGSGGNEQQQQGSGGDGQQQGSGGYPGGDSQQQGSGQNNQQQGSGAYDQQQQQGGGNSPYQQGSGGAYSRYNLGYYY